MHVTVDHRVWRVCCESERSRVRVLVLRSVQTVGARASLLGEVFRASAILHVRMSFRSVPFRDPASQLDLVFCVRDSSPWSRSVCRVHARDFFYKIFMCYAGTRRVGKSRLDTLYM